MADTAPQVYTDRPRTLPAAGGSASSASWPIPRIPPWVIVGTATVMATACGRFLADGRIKYGVALVLAAIYAPLVFLDLAAAVALWTAVLFVQDLRALSIAPNTMGLLVGLGWIGTVLTRGGRLHALAQHRRLVLWLGLFVLWMTLTTAWAQRPSIAANGAAYWALAALAFLVVVTTVTSIRDVGLITGGFVAGAVLAAAIGLAGGGLSAAATQAGQTAIQGRLTGGGGDPNLQAAAFVAAMFLTMGLLSVYRRRFARAALIVAFVIVTVAFFATQSRGGLVALAAASIAALVLSPGQRGRIIGLVLLACVVAAFVVAVNPGALQRITDIGGGTSGRHDIWNVATAIFKQHPIVGIGVNNFQIAEPHFALRPGNVTRVTYLVDTPAPVHNTYLQLLVETGVIGLIAFLAVVTASLRSAWLAARLFEASGRPTYAQLARAILMGTIGMLAAIFFITAGDDWRLWILLGLGPALLTLARRTAPAGTPANG
jgi:O-antigen ligase